MEFRMITNHKADADQQSLKSQFTTKTNSKFYHLQGFLIETIKIRIHFIYTGKKKPTSI
jgi:hypothetical protein